MINASLKNQSTADLNPMCKGCLHLGKDCDGDHGTTFTGCVWRVVELLVVDTTSLSIYKLSGTRNMNRDIAEAVRHNAEQIAKLQAFLNENPEHHVFKALLSSARKCRYEVMSYERFESLKRKRLLDKPMQSIDEGTFNDALNCLPPFKWRLIGSIEEFCVSEMTWGSLAEQYAHDRRAEKFYAKTVDVLDESTWIHTLIS